MKPRKLGLVVSLAAALCAACLSACASRTRSPQDIRDAYLDALRKDDPKRAYELLAPEARATLPFDEFAARWATMKTEREAIIANMEAMQQAAVVQQGTTVHRDGRMLRWMKLEGTYYVVEGLPGIPRTSTPSQTIRAFIRAVRSTDMSQVKALLGPSLASALSDDWQARVDAMEEALEQPEMLELSDDHKRAVLRYEPTRVITLEQTSEGWRIIGLE